jgi:hypothetical protein
MACRGPLMPSRWLRRRRALGTRKPEKDEPISLAPLTPEEALRALLAVKPDDTEKDRDPAQ